MKKITIIEDDLAILEMYRLKFEFEKFKVFTAINGKLGLESLEQNVPDVLLLDLMMPVMSGVETLTALRQTNWGKNLPVVILTNVSADEAPAALQHLGVEDYIVKANSTPQLVLAKVLEILKNKKS